MIFQPVLRGVGLAVLIAASLGTSCSGPTVFVFHRFELSASPDTAFDPPSRVALPTVALVRRVPKRYWWFSEPPRPLCDGFQVYTPADVRRVMPDSFELRPPQRVEVRLKRGPRPELVLFYRYSLPFHQLDTATAEGAAQARRIALSEEALAWEAEAFARTVLQGSGAAPIVPAAATDRIRDWKQFETRCRAEAQAGDGR